MSRELFILIDYGITSFILVNIFWAVAYVCAKTLEKKK